MSVLVLTTFPTFKSLGKASFLNVFHQHSYFNTMEQMPGHFHKTERSLYSFLVCVTLVRTVYFKKHIAEFTSLYYYSTSVQLFNLYSLAVSH